MLVDQGFWDASTISYPETKESPYTTHQHHHYSNNLENSIGRVIIHKYKSPHFIEQQQQTEYNKLKLLTHCKKCANPFQRPVTLSCGFTKCFTCLSPKEQCLSFSCFRTHSTMNNLKPTVLLEKILHQYNTTQNVEKSLLDCSICLGTLQEPITTECGHTFCKECLLRTMTELNKKACPYCRTELARIGKVNQVISGWIDYLFSSDNMDYDEQQGNNNTIPLIQVTSPAIAFPSQPCLIHISQGTSILLKNMIQQHPFKQPHYAICVFSNNQNNFFEYGIMLQINHVEHLPDIRHSVIQAQGLFRLKIHHLTMDSVDNCYTGNVTRFVDVLSNAEDEVPTMDQQFIGQTKNKRWTLPSTITPSQTTLVTSSRNRTAVTVAAATGGKSPRPRPFSMRLSSSAPNNYSPTTATSTLGNYPGSSSRRTWGTIMQSLNKPTSPPPLPLPSPTIKKPKIPSRTNSSSTVPSTASSSISFINTTTLDALFHQKLHPFIVQYLRESPYLLQQYEVQLQSNNTASLVWWLAAANILPLDYYEKIHLLSMDTLRERITTLIIWANDKCKSFPLLV